MGLGLVLYVLGVVLLLLAGVLSWPTTNPIGGYAHALGWLGLACVAIANKVA